MKEVSIFSFFSGIGFLDLGFEKSGFHVDFVNEIHQPFLDGYTYARANMDLPPPKYGYHHGSIDELLNSRQSLLHDAMKDARDASKLVGFIGGPPCPDFSVGGKNRGKDGENGKLSDSYIELICNEKPDFFIFENVKGLWRTKKHRQYYDQLKEKLISNGYALSDKLINAIEYGVPQDRDRIILFGVKRNLISDKKIEKSKGLLIDGKFDFNHKVKFPNRTAFDFPWISESKYKENSKRVIPKGIPEELTVEYWFKKNNVSKHPNSKDHFQPRAGIIRFESVLEGDDSKKSFKRLHRHRYSPTACYGNNEVHLHPYKSRRISVSESLAIQSMPEEFQLPEGMSLTNKFKSIGNGVPYIAAKGIASTINKFLTEYAT